MSYLESDPLDEPDEIKEHFPLVSKDICMDGQVLARFVSRKEMLDGEARGHLVEKQVI